MTSFWNRLRITQRFIVVLCAFVASVVAVAAIGLWGLSNARDNIKVLHDEAMANAVLAGQAIELAAQNRLEVLLAFQHSHRGELAAIHDHPVSLHLDAITARDRQTDALLKEMEQRLASPEERQLFEATQRAWAAWTGQLGRAVQAVGQQNYSPDVMAAFLAAGRQQGEALVKQLSELRNYQVDKADLGYQAAQQRYTVALITFLLAGLLLVLPSLVLALGLLKRLTRGFAAANAAATAIAANDLSQRVHHDGTDELGAMLAQMERMRANLTLVIQRVKDGTGTVAEASAEMTAGASDLSARTEQQASALEETAAATEQLASTVQQNSDNADRANQLASEATDVAQRGGAVVMQMVQTMEDMNQSARRITDIIDVIDNIAFQTNILALNAAVEAARAGVQGRGFAVVAGEVRSLAQHSANAAREVRTLINDSVTKAEAGHAQATQTGAAMEEVVAGIDRVARIVDEIALAGREQAVGLSQINQAVTHLDGVTQQNAALVEQTSAAAMELESQARQLAELAATFRIEASRANSAARVPALLNEA